MGRRGSGWAGEAVTGPGRQWSLEQEVEAGPERQRVGRRGSGWAGEAAAWLERQRLSRGAAAVEEGDEEAGPERQQLGWRAVSGLERQRPLEKGVKAGPERQRQGRRGSGWAGEQRLGWRGSGLAGEQQPQR